MGVILVSLCRVNIHGGKRVPVDFADYTIEKFLVRIGGSELPGRLSSLLSLPDQILPASSTLMLTLPATSSKQSCRADPPSPVCVGWAVRVLLPRGFHFNGK